MLFTLRCALCGEVIDAEDEVCSACKGSIERVELPTCGKCADSLYRCRCPHGRRRSYDYAVAVFRYRGSVKEGIRIMKFRNNTSGVKFFGREMYELYRRTYEDKNIDVIVPVPLYKSKEKQRGFNQSLLLAKEISQRSGLPVGKNLTKVKDTPAQHFLKREEREKNLREAFEASDDVQNKNILLIDDIITTGSTANECAGVLKRAGANKVFVLAAALTSE